MTIQCEISEEGRVSFRIDGTGVPFVPVALRVFWIHRLVFDDSTDHLTLLSEMLRLPPDAVLRLSDEVHSFPHAKVRNVRFLLEEGKHVLLADVEGTVPNLS